MESNDTLEIIRSQFASKDKMSIDYYVNNILEEFLENMTAELPEETEDQEQHKQQKQNKDKVQS